MTAIIQSAITIFLFFFILGSLVVIHELGHFITARLAGVRVLEFGIGFPPRAKVLRSKGETLYTLNWLPIGGFVRLEGEDGDSDDPRSFVRARLPVKLIILVAGVAMNLVLAFAIFVLIAWLATPLIGVVVSRSRPARRPPRAGCTSGDRIITVDGRAIRGHSAGPADADDDLRDHGRPDRQPRGQPPGRRRTDGHPALAGRDRPEQTPARPAAHPGARGPLGSPAAGTVDYGASGPRP